LTRRHGSARRSGTLGLQQFREPLVDGDGKTSLICHGGVIVNKKPVTMTQVYMSSPDE